MRKKDNRIGALGETKVWLSARLASGLSRATAVLQAFMQPYIIKHCWQLNFKSARFLYPQCPSIGVADFVFEK